VGRREERLVPEGDVVSEAVADADALATALLACDDDGRRLYDDAVARDVAVLLALDVARAVELPDALLALLGQAVLAAGLKGDEPADTLASAVRAHLEQRIPAPLLRLVARSIREQSARRGGDAAAAQALLGVEASRAPLGGGVRPAGTVAASPLARFLVDAPKPRR
jgi:hypothetical protein